MCVCMYVCRQMAIYTTPYKNLMIEGATINRYLHTVEVLY